MAAAHCYNDFDVEATNTLREVGIHYTSLLYRYKYVLFKIKINTIRDTTPQNQELLEMKKVYTHPNYVYPSLYDDIAVVELGRRIVYDYEKVKICCYFFDLIKLASYYCAHL